MIRIHPLSFQNLELACTDALPDEVSALSPKPDEGAQPTVQIPSLEVSYDEITPEQVDAIFGYENISGINGPIGVPGLDIPIISQGAGPHAQFLFFPLVGFQKFLQDSFPTISTEFEKAGGMDGYAQLKVDDMDVEEYLVGGLLELTRHCLVHGKVLQVTW